MVAASHSTLKVHYVASYSCNGWEATKLVHNSYLYTTILIAVATSYKFQVEIGAETN